MSPKRLPRRWIFATAALLLAGLLFAPATPAQANNHNQVILNIYNATSSEIIVIEGMVTQGQWVQGQQPVSGTTCPASSNMAPISTFSPVQSEGNGGILYLNVGSISWKIPWDGAPQVEVKLTKGIQSEINGPLPYRDPRHVIYNITLYE